MSKQLQYVEYNGRSIPVIVHEGVPLFMANDLLAAAGYTTHGCVTRLQFIPTPDRCRIHRTMPWMEEGTKTVLFPARNGVRVFLTYEGVVKALKPDELAKADSLRDMVRQCEEEAGKAKPVPKTLVERAREQMGAPRLRKPITIKAGTPRFAA